MTSSQLAREMGQSESTVRDWLRAWHALGVAGIRVVPSRGRYGRQYLVARDLITRWLDCQLPAPRAPVTRGTHNESHASTQQAVLSATG